MAQDSKSIIATAHLVEGRGEDRMIQAPDLTV